MNSDVLETNVKPPKVLMLIGTRCAYCLPMMQALVEIMKSGHIAELNIINIENDSQVATQFGVRSVPWVKLGSFELTGSRSKQELLQWLQRASSFDGITMYIEETLSEGNVQSINKLIQQQPESLRNVIALMADAEAKINVRLGVGVVIEEIAETQIFKSIIPDLIAYLSNDDARVRGDACHYLSLTKDPTYVSDIKALLLDESMEVREIAQDSLDDLLTTSE